MVRGFRRIELIVVIALLGVLAAVALPRFVDVSDETRQATVLHQAGVLTSNNTLNVAACKVGSADCIQFSATGFNPGVCQEALNQLLPKVAEQFQATTFASTTPREQWTSLAGEEEAFFLVTRTVDVPFPQDVPCILSFID